jgi:hypothetical protein
MGDIPIARMLKGFGITHPGAQQTARAALAEAGVISRPDRTNLADYKVSQAHDSLSEAFLWHCGSRDCRQKAAARAEPLILVQKRCCRICGGSSERAALIDLAGEMAAARISRVLVVGGTEAKSREILEASPPKIEWRFVDGLTARHERYYRDNRDWAEVIVLWSSTPLSHKVSFHFDGKGDSRTVTVTRRSVAALAGEIVGHLRNL